MNILQVTKKNLQTTLYQNSQELSQNLSIEYLLDFGLSTLQLKEICKYKHLLHDVLIAAENRSLELCTDADFENEFEDTQFLLQAYKDGNANALFWQLQDKMVLTGSF